MKKDIHKAYSEDSIKILEGLEAVRKRPSMYIGNVSVEGLHHLVYEVVDNSIDEAMAGFCDKIEVKIYTDNSVSVEDNGRGIPVGLHKKENISAAEVVMTRLHAGGKFDNDSYKVSGGLHGVGVSVVNALSAKLYLEIYSGGYIYSQTYEKGTKTSELSITGKTDKQGTKVHFQVDKEILDSDNFEYDILTRRLRELAFLNKGVEIGIEDERSEQKDLFHYEGGLSEFVNYLNRRHATLHDPMFFEGIKNEVRMEVAIQYNDTFKETILSFANNIKTIEGGFHLIGFKAALTRSLNKYVETGNLPKNLQSKISGDDVREGLTAVISIRIKSPQFEGQTKTKLGNSEVKGLVESLLNEKLSLFLEENPAIAKRIIEKAIDAARARDAARRARDLARKQGSFMDSHLPGKLAECQYSEPEDREIFIVEGDSAGGSAKQGRDRKFQAILPLKGKILNVEKSRFDKILSSEEIKNIITALGTGVGKEEYNIDNVRYHKVIIMTDADVDGSHIRTLLLTFFFRQMPELLEKGYLYIAQPPLFRVGKGNKAIYLKDEIALNDHVIKRISASKILAYGKNKNLIKAEKFYDFIKLLADYFANLNNFERQEIEAHLIEIMLKEGVEDKSFLQNEQKMSILRGLLLKEGYDVGELIYHEERDIYEINVKGGSQGLKRDSLAAVHFKNKISEIKIGTSLIYSKDYQSCLSSYERICVYDSPPFYVFNTVDDKDSIHFDNKRMLFTFLMEEGKKGLGIQRYKGLGEMNPDQLWETTMDPDKRTLLQVKIEDIIDSDEIFTILMGEDVEPRREFIQNNALKVSTLDI
jgi:DNA gyrase subunit B